MTPEVMRICWQEACKWRPDHFREDLYQEALLAIWLDGITDPKLIRVAARRQMIDVYRAVFGRPERTYRDTKTGEHVTHPATAKHAAEHVSADKPVANQSERGIVLTYGMTLHSSDDVESIFLAMETDEALAHAIGKITPNQREVMSAYAQGEPTHETAKRLGMAEGTVFCHRSKGRQQILNAVSY